MEGWCFCYNRSVEPKLSPPVISCVFNTLSLQINACGRHRNDGYEFMWVANDVWNQVKMNITWSRWHGKNANALSELGSRWEIGDTHIIRSTTYKGENQVASLPGFRYDAFSTLGLFQAIGVLAQVRGLAGATQHRLIALLHEALRFSIWPNGLNFLPDCILPVENGHTSLRQWLSTLPRSERTMIKTRWGIDGI